jgi:Glycosyltransferases involved in cell wall biogenesis
MIMKKFSIVLPIYGNEKNLPISVPYIMERLSLFENYSTEIIMVCDGSPDNSYEVMKKYQAEYPDKIKIAKFVRNRGQRAAVNCGFSLATGDVIGVISADLQDPFELFAEMLEQWEKGEKLIIARRDNRAEKGLAVKCSKILHKFINKNVNSNYPQGGFDFFVVDRCIAEEFIKSDTKNNSMQLLLLELAGKPYEIGYTRSERKVGKSGWKLNMKLDQLMNIFTIYSAYPYYFFMTIGILLLTASLVFYIIKIVSLIRNGLGADLYGMYGTVFMVGGIITEILAYNGLAAFKAMQNNFKGNRYIITEIIDETEKKNVSD